MSEPSVRDVLKRSLRQVSDKLAGLVGDRLVTIHIDDVVSLTVPIAVNGIRQEIDYKLQLIYEEENAEIEGKYFRGGKSVQS